MTLRVQPLRVVGERVAIRVVCSLEFRRCRRPLPAGVIVVRTDGPSHALRYRLRR